MTVQDAASLLGVKCDSLYRVIKRCQKSKPVFHRSGLSFAICQTARRILLIPLDAPPVDVEKTENAAAAKILAMLLPCLCDRCRSSVEKIKGEYERG
jgi:hypothetical protein